MQNACVKALIITHYCGLSSLAKRALCSCAKMDSWLIKQSKSVKSDIDQLYSRSFSCRKKRRVRKYQTDFPTFGFTYQLVNGEEHPKCVVYGEVFANNSFKARYLRTHLTTKHESFANKPLQFF
jgi:hypothetical protein